MSEASKGSLHRRSAVRLILSAAFTPLSIAWADPIHDAASTGNLAEVKRLLAEDPKRRESLNGDHLTPLLLAVFRNHLDVATYLLEQGADVEARKADGTPALYDAAYNGNVEMARLLLAHGAKVDARNGKGETALHAAVFYDKPEVASFLLTQKADPNLGQNEGKTPLRYALETKHAALAPILIGGGADIRAVDSSGVSPQLFAVGAAARGGSDDNPALTAFWAALPPVSLHLTNAPLGEAYTQLFAQIKVKVAVDAALTSTVSLTIDDPFDVALRTLLRMTRRTMGQAPEMAVAGDNVKIGAVSVADTAANEVWPIFTRDPRYQFHKTISREVLHNYLSHGVTHHGLLASSPEQPTPYFDDDLRMLTNVGAKMVGNCAYAWVPPDDDDAHFRLAAERASRLHRADPEMILQASIFEAVYRKLENIRVPAWVFEEFKLPVEARNFHYEAMLYSNGKFRDHWMHDASVPDISKRETQFWFFYRARRYIESGCESIHFGQVGLMDQADPGHVHWRDMLRRVRQYAARSGRRSMVLCEANTHGIAEPGPLMFDYHSWPIRPAEAPTPTNPEGCEMRIHEDSIIRHSMGGVTPSGWSCDSLPYALEFDNTGKNRPGVGGLGAPWVWGYEEISWFARQTEAQRNQFLIDARDWLRRTDSAGHLHPSTRRRLADPVASGEMYQANRKSDACPIGFNQEDTIRELFRS